MMIHFKVSSVLLLILSQMVLENVRCNDDYLDNYDEIDEESPTILKAPETERTIEIISSKIDLNCSVIENMKIIEASGKIFIASGPNIFHLNISSLGKQLNFVCELSGIEDRIIDIRASHWNDFIIFVAATKTKYNIYIGNDGLKTVPILVEKIPMYGQHRKFVLFQNDDKLYMIIGGSLKEGEASSMIRLYSWKDSLFTQLETRIISHLDDMLRCEMGQETLIAFLQNDAASNETLIQIYRFDDGTLRYQQNLHFSMGPIHLYPFGDKCFLLGIFNGKVTSYAWDGNGFYKYYQHKDLLQVTHLTAGQGLIALQDKGQILAFTQPALSFNNALAYSTPSASNLKITNSNGQVYLVAFFVQANCMKIQFFEVQFKESVKAVVPGDQTNLLNNDCSSNLKNFLHQRQLLLDKISSKIPHLLYANKNLEIHGPIQTNRTIQISNGKINQVKINATVKVTANDLRNEIIKLNERLRDLKMSGHRINKRETAKAGNYKKIDTLNVTNLMIKNGMFKNILLKSKNMHLNGKVSTKSIDVAKIKDELSTEILKNPNIGGQFKPSIDLKMDAVSGLKYLKVKRINGLDWNNFYKSLYLKGKRTTISGNLYFNSSVSIKDLNVETINGVPVELFMTTATNQTIQSTLLIPNFFAVNIDAKQINGIYFSGKNLATIKADNFIESPIKISNCNIIGNLSLSDEENQVLSRHIVGTKLEDLSQIYSGKVVIKGSLKLRNLILDTPTVAIIIANQSFDLNVSDKYWMKSVDQKFGSVKFTAPIEAPQIFTKLINSNPADTLLLVNVNPKVPLNLIIKSAKVYGSVISASKLKSRVVEISRAAIRRNVIATITGRKKFQGVVIVDDFICAQMDHPSMLNLYLRKYLPEFILPSMKEFDQLTIIGDVITNTNNIQIKNLNGRDLFDFRESIVRLDQPIDLGVVTFKNLTAKNIGIGTIGGITAEQFIELFESSVGGHGIIKNVRVSGDVSFGGNVIVDIVNGINLQEYLKLVVSLGMGGQIKGMKRFTKGITAETIISAKVGPIDLRYWLENALAKRTDQTITGTWTFDTLKSNIIEASMINGVWTNQLVDLSSEFIKIKSDLILTSAEMHGSLYGQMPCDITELEHSIGHYSKKKSWKFIQIDGQAEWSTGIQTRLNLILQNAVVNGVDQVITGEVVFAQPTQIKKLISKGHINNVNILAMHADALTKSGDFQLISGRKRFMSPISIRNVITEKDLQFPIVNGVNILNLNGSIFRLAEGNVITGKKIFEIAPLIGYLTVKGSVHGINPSDIVCINSTQFAPPTRFLSGIRIKKRLTVEKINSMPFDFFIKNRIRKSGKIQEVHGVITFQNLGLTGNAQIPSINKIQPNDVVNQKSNTLQEITGHKIIEGHLNLAGPAAISNVNNKNLIQTFTRSIRLDRDEKIHGLEPINMVTLSKGLKVKKKINDVEIGAMNSWTPPSLIDFQPMWTKSKLMVSDVQQLAIEKVHNQKKFVVYLDFAKNLEIITESHPKDFTFLIDTLLAGNHCGLTYRCECPAQYGVRVTPVYRLYINRREPFRRTMHLNGQNCSLTIDTSFVNPCTSPEISAITLITWKLFNKTVESLVMNEPVVGAKLLEFKNITMLLLNFNNGTVSSLELDAPTKRWINPTFVHNSSYKIDILQWESYRILVTFSPKSTNEHSHGTLDLYFFKEMDFIPFQTISGDYDLCSSIYVDRIFFMFLGKIQTKTVTIFKADYNQKHFRRFILVQKLEFETAIKSFVTFSVDDTSFIATVTSSGYFYLHKYNYIEGWAMSTYGHSKDIEAIVPFNYYDKTYLFVSGSNTATAMVVYHQVVH